jgi:hypothetical protein
MAVGIWGRCKDRRLPAVLRLEQAAHSTVLWYEPESWVLAGIFLSRFPTYLIRRPPAGMMIVNHRDKGPRYCTVGGKAGLADGVESGRRSGSPGRD